MSKNHKNLLFLCQNRKGNGTYWRAFALAKEIVNQGHSVTLLCTRDTPGLSIQHDFESGVHIIKTPSGNLFGKQSLNGYSPVELVIRIFIVFVSQSFDIVYAFENRPTVLLPALLARLKKASYYTDWCDLFGKGGFVEDKARWLRWWLRPIETIFDTRFRKLARGISVINLELYQKAQLLGFSDKQIILIRNGIEPFNDIIDIEYAKKKQGLSKNTLVIGFLSSITQQDQMLLADAVNILFAEHPTAYFLHVGYKNIDIFQNIKDRGRCIATGFLPEKTQVMHALSACDVLWLLFSSNKINNNRWPSKLSEYLVAERPIIAIAGNELKEFLTSFSQISFANDAKDLVVCTIRKSNTSCAVSNAQAIPTSYSWNSLALNLLDFWEIKSRDDQ